MLKRQRLAEGTGSWTWIGTVILSDNIGDAPSFDEHAQLVMTNLDLITILETERTVVDRVVLGGRYAQHAVAETLRDLYPNVHVELKSEAHAVRALDSDHVEFRVA
jgi:hypothetical protein